MTSLPDLHKFKELTGIEIKLDAEYSAMTGNMEIDIFELDEQLKSKYPDEYTECMSSKDFIESKWGFEAMNIVTKALDLKFT